MSNQVTATGMWVKAKADSGIVIKAKSTNQSLSIPATASTFKSTADWNMSAGAELYPTSTVDTSSWYTALSDDKANAKPSQPSTAYTQLNSNFSSYYALFDYYIRSSAEAVAVSGVKLAVKEVKVTPKTTTSENLDKSVRVAVAYTNGSNTTVYFYSPLSDTDTVAITPGYNTTGITARKAAGTSGEGSNLTYTDTFTLPSNQIPANDTGLFVTIYIYFEGEDVNCKSMNITSALDNLDVEVTFTTVSAGA